MKILFFSNIPIKQSVVRGYNGGGWISSLINQLSSCNNIEMAVGFFGSEDKLWKENGVSFYQICGGAGKNKLKKFWKAVELLSPNYIEAEKKSWTHYEDAIMKAVDDFSPDIIHVFGSERHFGLIANRAKRPLVLHIQGILNPYLNAYLPPAFSWRMLGSFAERVKFFVEKRLWNQRCFREREILSRVKYHIGRTIWDERVTKLFNPKAVYFWGNEILRDVFYEECNRAIPNKLIIVSTISRPLYKGYDVILKTADILKNVLKFEFEWNVYGNVNPTLVEKNIGIKHNDACVYLKGVASPEVLRDEICRSTVYVHPSYIDNSPNSVCEAQLLGATVVASNVGGVPSLIDDGKTGFLVPANDPYQMAYLIKLIYEDDELNRKIGETARKMALKRHNRDEIVKKLLSDYDVVINFYGGDQSCSA